jgi:hypothetical protein
MRIFEKGTKDYYFGGITSSLQRGEKAMKKPFQTPV